MSIEEALTAVELTANEAKQSTQKVTRYVVVHLNKSRVEHHCSRRKEFLFTQASLPHAVAAFLDTDPLEYSTLELARKYLNRADQMPLIFQVSRTLERLQKLDPYLGCYFSSTEQRAEYWLEGVYDEAGKYCSIDAAAKEIPLMSFEEIQKQRVSCRNWYGLFADKPYTRVEAFEIANAHPRGSIARVLYQNKIEYMNFQPASESPRPGV